MEETSSEVYKTTTMKSGKTPNSLKRKSAAVKQGPSWKEAEKNEDSDCKVRVDTFLGKLMSDPCYIAKAKVAEHNRKAFAAAPK